MKITHFLIAVNLIMPRAPKPMINTFSIFIIFPRKNRSADDYRSKSMSTPAAMARMLIITAL